MSRYGPVVGKTIAQREPHDDARVIAAVRIDAQQFRADLDGAIDQDL